MTISLYDKVRLRDGRTATIVEVYEAGKAYEADIDDDGECVTDTIKHEDILEII